VYRQYLSLLAVEFISNNPYISRVTFCLIELRGGAEFPTGGDLSSSYVPGQKARERLADVFSAKVSRFGATPKPTVIVRMKEDRLYT
jgi:hypothetical protein